MASEPDWPLRERLIPGALILLVGAALCALAIAAWDNIDHWSGWLVVPAVLAGMIAGWPLAKFGVSVLRGKDD